MFRSSSKRDVCKNSRQNKSRASVKSRGGNSYSTEPQVLRLKRLDVDENAHNTEPKVLHLKRLDVDEEEKVASKPGNVFRRIFRLLKWKKKTKPGESANSSEPKPPRSKLTFNALWSVMVATKETSRSLKKECNKIDITLIQSEIEDVLEQIDQKQKVLKHSYCSEDATDEELEDELDAIINNRG